ncbi:MAG: hypothetical protein AAFQ94_01360 [Bacteroidota bacterium]
MKRLSFIIVLFSLINTTTFAQTEESQLQLMIDEGVILMNQKEYVKADQKFTVVIDRLKPLPNKMAFFFGKNSFFLNEYKQSINWLSKYIQLKGTSGTFYEEAKLYLEQAEKKYLEANKDELAKIENDLSNDFDCYSQDKMRCPVCRGTGVRITKGIMGNTYETCPYSEGTGYLTCEEYNLYFKGKLKPKKIKNQEN